MDKMIRPATRPAKGEQKGSVVPPTTIKPPMPKPAPNK